MYLWTCYLCEPSCQMLWTLYVKCCEPTCMWDVLNLIYAYLLLMAYLSLWCLGHHFSQHVIKRCIFANFGIYKWCKKSWLKINVKIDENFDAKFCQTLVKPLLGYRTSLVILLLYRWKKISAASSFCTTKGQKCLFNSELTMLVHQMDGRVIWGMKFEPSVK
jgi:hypothetical protein